MNASNIKNIIEAALMVSSQPLPLDKLQGLFAKDAVQPDREVLRSTLNELAEECNGRGVELKEVASGWRYQVRADYAEWVNRLWEEKPARYSRALLETLAIIAYRQPITRGEIEDIRGVGVSANIIRTLQEREWIKVVGHRDVPGKPELLATTKEFLDYFNLKKLSDLPTLAEIRDLDEINPDLFAELNGSQARQEQTADSGEGAAAEVGGETEDTEEAREPDDGEIGSEAADGASAAAIDEENETGASAEQDTDSEPSSADEDEDTGDDDKVVQFSK